VSVKTEDSILRAVLEDIKCAARSNETQKNSTESNAVKNGEIDEKDYKTELRKQIETGEITPFEAIFKQSVLEQRKEYISLF